MRRRVAISVDQTTPVMAAATARCQGRTTPLQAKMAMLPDDRPAMICPVSNTCLRFSDSLITPEKAPSSNIGMVRADDTKATSRPEPVTSKVNSAADSSSNHRMVFTQPPIAHRRRNDGAAIRARRPPVVLDVPVVIIPT